MAGIPQNFQAISNVLANYNFVDITSGTGYINLYAGNTVDKYLLSNFTYYSDTGARTLNTNTGGVAYKLGIDLDFDTVLLRPMDLKGYGIVNIPLRIYSQTGGIQVDAYVKVTVRKWDGVTETDIVTNDSTVVSTTLTSASGVYHMLAVDVDIPLTHFKIGETLRLTTQVYSKGADASTDIYTELSHDPINRSAYWDSSAVVPSRLVFQCPVRLNL